MNEETKAPLELLCNHCGDRFTDQNEFWKHLSKHHATISSGVPVMLNNPPPPEPSMMADKIEQLEKECSILRDRLDHLENGLHFLYVSINR